ncbi:hypothetical protein FOA52_004235 [Chlamydomonas sp. UWO 241]|nr:hypothetical protein FOA52_004235 [Chlamydomonas sp. UWO 241]
MSAPKCLKLGSSCQGCVGGGRQALVVRAAKQGSNPFRDGGSSGGGDKKGGGGGGGGKGSGGGGFKPSQSSQGGGRKPAPARSRDTPVQKDLTISRPLTATLLEEGKVDRAADPFWSTFCNHLNGEWFGQYSAYTPWEGLPEPVWLDDNNKYIDFVYSRSVEHRGEDADGEDRLIRKIGRATTMDAAQRLPIPLEGSVADDDNVDVEALAYNAEGVVVFDGGNYSAGPDFIGPPEFKMLQEPLDDGEGGDAGGSWGSDGEGEGSEQADAPTTTSVLEHTLIDWGTKLRVRIVATVRIGHTDTGEVDLAVLRLVLHREVWAGTPGGATLESARALLEPVPCTKLPRPTPKQVCGEWSCFTIGAVGIEEEDPTTGDERVVWVYSSSEYRQEWELPSGREGPTDGDDGGTLWLPGGVLVTFQMVDMDASAGGGRGGAAAAAAASQPRGLCMSTTWLQPGSATAMTLERFYDGGGVLRDVRFTQAVRSSLAGPSM